MAAHAKLENNDWTGFNAVIQREVTNSDIQQEKNRFSGNVNSLYTFKPQKVFFLNMQIQSLLIY